MKIVFFCTVFFFFTYTCLASDGDFLIRAEAQQSAVPPPPPLPIAYDDGTPVWFTWSGIYRGVWFDLEDFVMEPPMNYYLTSVEMWFYHHTSYPWDTSSFFCELWMGGLWGPMNLMDTNFCTAQHYTAINCMFEDLYWIDNYFWIVLDLTQSAGGWPSSLSDGTPRAGISHSYVSDDFIIWEPWTIDQTTTFPLNLISLSWGSLRALF